MQDLNRPLFTVEVSPPAAMDEKGRLQRVASGARFVHLMQELCVHVILLILQVERRSSCGRCRLARVDKRRRPAVDTTIDGPTGDEHCDDDECQ